MSTSTELHVVIPGICGPLAETETLKTNQTVNQWLTVLSRSLQSTSANGVNDVVADLCSMRIENDFPSAILSLKASGLYDSSRFYMHADPVHLRADIDSAVLSSSKDLSITNEEASLLCDMLNQHFAQDDLIFIMLDKDQWFVSCKEKIQLQTTALNAAVGRNINFILPKGRDATLWSQRLTEAQMLMHSHELNTDREHNGLLSINSLWFHGSGELAIMNSAENAVSGICSDQTMFEGLAEYLQCDYIKMPETVNGYLDFLSSSHLKSKNILCLQDIEHLTNYSDTRPWSEKLKQVLDEWVYPLLNSATKNNMKVILHSCDGKQYQFSKYDRLKLWRKRKLNNYITSY